MNEGEIIAVGGDWRDWLFYAKGQAEVAFGKDLLSVSFLPTAAGDNKKDIDDFNQLADKLQFQGSVLSLFADVADQDLSSLLLAQDIVVIPGGREEVALAAWEEEGIADALREFYGRGGIILAAEEGAGLLFKDSLDRHGNLFSGYSFLPYSLCLNQTHYQEKYQQLIEKKKISAGYMINRREGLHFRGSSLWRALSLETLLEVSHLNPEGKEKRIMTTIVEES